MSARYAAALAVAAGLVLSGCTTTTDGQRVTAPPTSSTSAAPTARPTPHTQATPTSAAPTGMQPLSTPSAIFADVKRFWEFDSGSDIVTGVTLVPDPDAPTCDGGTYADATAAACGTASDGTIVYSVPRMTELLAQPRGDMAATIVLAHEYGHSIQSYSGSFPNGSTGRTVNGVKGVELSADCLAGFYVDGRRFNAVEVIAALGLTAIGQDGTRIAAFNAGMATDKPNTCLKDYE